MEYHNSPNAMARVLVQYIGSNERIYREVLATFDSSPCIETISLYRTIHERAVRRAPRDHDASVVWMDERHSKDMDRANRQFVAAIYLARLAA